MMCPGSLDVEAADHRHGRRQAQGHEWRRWLAAPGPQPSKRFSTIPPCEKSRMLQLEHSRGSGSIGEQPDWAEVDACEVGGY